MLKQLIEQARGEVNAEIVFKNARYVDVFSGQIKRNDIAISNGIIIGIGSYHGETEYTLENEIIVPGFIDGHVHIESSMLSPIQFSKIVLPHGTTTVVADPHELANVLGIEGIKYIAESSRYIPLDVHVMIPSCVPVSPYETAGAVIDARDIETIKDFPGMLGLGEMMDYPGIIHGEKKILDKLEVMQHKVIDGHAPSVKGNDLNAYVLPGIKTDHECTTKEELLEKIGLGMYIFLREGSATRNVAELAQAVTKENCRRLMFCTDDKHPFDIRNEGHINYNIKVAMDNGVDFISAIRMATINTAECYGLSKTGGIAPGYKADLVVLENEENMNVLTVLKDGKIVAKDKEIVYEEKTYKSDHKNSVHIKSPITLDLKLKQDQVKVIKLIKNNIITQKLVKKVMVDHGVYVNNSEDDILKLAVVERHKNTGNIGLGLVEGYGLKNGSVAMTIAHDSHNLICVGDNDRDMLIAIEELKQSGGGITLVQNGEVIDTLALEIGGLITNQDVSIVEEKLNYMEQFVRKMGVHSDVDDPFLSLAFLSLVVIPDLKLTDKGLFDVNEFRLVEIEE